MNIGLNVVITQSGEKVFDWVSGKLRSIGQDGEKAGAVLKSTGERVTALGTSISAATLPMAAAVVGSLRAATSFNTAMTESLAIMGTVTDATRAKLEDTARSVALTTKFSATQAAESYYFLASAGLTAEQSIGALPQVAQFAQAGLIDMAKATEYLMDSTKALGLSVETDLGRVSDVITKAAIMSNTSLEQLAQSLTTKAATSARTFGVSLEQTAAVLSVYADQGIKGQIAGERFDILLRELTKHAGELKSAMGVDVFNPTTGALNNMSSIIAQVEQKFAGMSTAQKVAALDSANLRAESQSAVLALVGMSGQISTYEAALLKAGGATEEVAKKQLQSFSEQLKLLQKAVTDAGITLGNALMPILTNLAQTYLKPAATGVKGLAEEFSRLPSPVQTAAFAITAVVLAGGPLLMTLGFMVKGIGELSVVAGLFTKALTFLGNTVPVLTARLWLMEASWAGAAAGVKGFLAAAAPFAAVALVGAAVGFAIGKIADSVIDKFPGARKEVDLFFQGLYDWYNKIDRANLDAKAATGLTVGLKVGSPEWNAKFGGGPGAPTPPGAGGPPPLGGDDLPKVTKMSESLTAEMLKVQAASKGTYASMIADSRAATMQKLAEIASWKLQGPEIDALKGRVQALGAEALKVAKLDFVRNMLGSAPGDAARTLTDIGQAIEMVGGDITKLDPRMLGEAIDKITALGAEGTTSALGVKLLAEETRRLAEARAMVAKILPPRTDLWVDKGPGYQAPLPPLNSAQQLDIQTQAWAGYNEMAQGLQDKVEAIREKTIDWRGALDEVRNTFEIVGISANSVLGTLVGIAAAGFAGAAGLKSVATDFGAGFKAASGLSAVLKDAGLEGLSFTEKVGVGLKNIDWGKAIASIGQIAGAFLKATDSASGLQRAMGGAMVGAQVGAQFGGAWGAAIGAAIGGIVGLFRKPSWAKVGEEAGRILGLAAGESLSKELSQQIEKTSKTLKVSVQVATLLNLDKVMAETGKAASTFVPQVQQLFAGIAKGTVPMAQGVEQIGKAFTAMAQEADAAGGLASDAMRQIIATSMATGIRVKEVSDYIKGLATDAAPALEAKWKVLGPETEKVGDKMATLGRLTSAAFQAMLFGGASVVEAFQTLGPAIDAAVDAAERSGVELSGAMGEMAGFRNLIKANEDLVNSVTGTSAIIKLAAAGFGNMADAVGLVSTDYDALTAAGFSNAQALAIQAPALRQLDQLYRRGLIPTLDEATQAHIAEAQAMGLLDPTPQEAMAEATQQLVVLMGLLVQTMGVALPAAIQESINKWMEFNKTAGGTPGAPGPPGGPGGGPGGGGGGPNAGGEGFAEGLLSPALPADGLFKLHKGERVEVTPAAQTPERNARDERGGRQVSFGPGSVVVQFGDIVQSGMTYEELVAGVEQGTAQAFITAMRQAP